MTFSSYKKVSQLTVKECILIYAPKSCELDPIPSKLLIECIDSNLPSFIDLFNSSLASGIFPQCFKSALVTPILKKRCLDHNDLNIYRPVSNPFLIDKILEKNVFSHVSSYLNSHNLINQHIVQVTALKQLFRKLLVICFFLISKATNLYKPCLTYLQHLTQFIILSLQTVSILTLDLLILSCNGFHLI